jgi:hypothetical protein
MEELTNDLQADGAYLTWLSVTWPALAQRLQGRLEPERAYRQWVSQCGVCAATGLPLLPPTKRGKSMYTAVLVRRTTDHPMAAHGNHVYVCNFVATMWNAVSTPPCSIKSLDMFARLCGFVCSES